MSASGLAAALYEARNKNSNSPDSPVDTKNTPSWLAQFDQDTIEVLKSDNIIHTKRSAKKIQKEEPKTALGRCLQRIRRNPGDEKKEVIVEAEEVPLEDKPKVVQLFAKITRHNFFDNFILVCVVLVAIGTGIETSYSSYEEKDKPAALFMLLTFFNQAMTATFTLECIAKIIAVYPIFSKYFQDSFNFFDFLIVCASIFFEVQNIKGSKVGVLRLMRLIKIMNKFPSLRVILLGLVSGMKSVGNIMLLLFLVIYIYAIAGMILFSENDPFHFGSVMVSMLTLFRTATTLDWVDIYQINYYGCEIYNAGIYVNEMREGEIRENNKLDFVYIEQDDDVTNGKVWLYSQYGKFPYLVCYNPIPSPYSAMVYFISFTAMTAFVILTLFISVITVSMFEVIHEMEMQIERSHKKNAPAAAELLKQQLTDGSSPLIPVLRKAFKETREIKEMTTDQKIRLVCRRIHDSYYFEMLIVFCICTVGISAGVNADIQSGFQKSFRHEIEFLVTALDLVISFIFDFEIIVKFGSMRWKYFHDSWNTFDFVIALASKYSYVFTNSAFINVTGLRLFRLFKLAKSVPSLRGVVESLMESFGSVTSVMAIFMLFNYIMAVMGVMLFAGNDTTKFSTLPMAFTTIWMSETLDEWDQFMYTAVYGCVNFGYYSTIYDPQNVTRKITYPTQAKLCDAPYAYGWLAALYYVFLVIFGGLILPTVLIGVISISFESSTNNIAAEKNKFRMEHRIRTKVKQWEEKEGRKILSKKQTNWMRVAFTLMDNNKTGELQQLEVLPVIEYISTQYMSGGINASHINVMFDIMDVDNDETIDWCEFIWFIANIKHKLRAGEASVETKDKPKIGNLDENKFIVYDQVLLEIDDRIQKLQEEREKVIEAKKKVARSSVCGAEETDHSTLDYITNLQDSFGGGDGYFTAGIFCGDTGARTSDEDDVSNSSSGSEEESDDGSEASAASGSDKDDKSDSDTDDKPEKPDK